MRRGIRSLACAVGLAAAWSTPAVAAPANGMLAVVADGKLVSLNPDGSGLRGLEIDASGVTELAFSPDGNRLAIVDRGRIDIVDLPARRRFAITAAAGAANLGWSHDGTTVGFRRGARVYRVAVGGGAPVPDPEPLPEGTTEIAWRPGLEGFTPVLDGHLALPTFEQPRPIIGAPAWGPDGETILFADRDGVAAVSGQAARRLAGPPARVPRWSPDGHAVVYVAGNELRGVAGDGEPRVLLRAQRIVAADWQPCVADTVRCASIALPRCSASVQIASTLAGEAVELPAPPCSDPAGLPLSLLVVSGPAHGTLDGRRYTPVPGFTGEDAVTYRVSNGAGESEPVRVTIFVVARPATAAPPPSSSPAGPDDVVSRPRARRAPFLSARATPWLSRRRRARVRVACDQDCALTVRLTARLRSKRTLNGPRVRRKARAGRVLTLRLRLPSRPRGALRTVWIVGRVRDAAGNARRVRLPVRIRR